MGIERLKYKPWQGERNSQLHRIYAMVKKVFKHKTKSKGFLLFLIIGIVLVHVFPIITNSLTPHSMLTPAMMVFEGGVEGSQEAGYLTGGLFPLFTLLIAAVVCSDLVSQDLKDNSFILYFSRPIKAWDYVLGKVGGSFTILGLFCLLVPIIFCLAVIGTQSGGDYLGSLEVLGSTVVAGSLTVFIFGFYGTMISSLTERRSFAGVGAFVSFFVLGIVSDIFSEVGANWELLDPFNVLNYSYRLIYGFELPSGVDLSLFWLAFALLIIVPPIVLYYRIRRRVFGR